MFNLRKKLEEVWTRRWAGVILTLIFTIVVGCLFYWIPPPGVSVAVMGVLAAVVSLRTKATGTEKGVWMLLISSCLVIEVGAIKKERLLNEFAEARRVEEQRQHFSEIGNGIKSSIAQTEANFNTTMSRSDKLIVLEGQLAPSLRTHHYPWKSGSLPSGSSAEQKTESVHMRSTALWVSPRNQRGS